MPNIKSSCKLKNNKSSCNCKYKIISAILAVAVLGLSAAVVCLTRQLPSRMDKKRLVAFETLASAFINSDGPVAVPTDPETGNYHSTFATGIGITDDNDLYVDFTLRTTSPDGILLSVKPGRLHLQCADRSGTVFNTNTPESCGMAYWYGDEEETSEEFRATAAEYGAAVKRYVDATNAAETEEERARIHAEYDEFAKQYEDFFNDYAKLSGTKR